MVDDIDKQMGSILSSDSHRDLNSSTAQVLYTLEKRGINLTNNLAQFIYETAQAESGMFDNPLTVVALVPNSTAV